MIQRRHNIFYSNWYSQTQQRTAMQQHRIQSSVPTTWAWGTPPYSLSSLPKCPFQDDSSWLNRKLISYLSSNAYYSLLSLSNNNVPWGNVPYVRYLKLHIYIWFATSTLSSQTVILSKTDTGLIWHNWLLLKTHCILANFPRNSMSLNYPFPSKVVQRLCLALRSDIHSHPQSKILTNFCPWLLS